MTPDDIADALTGAQCRAIVRDLLRLIERIDQRPDLRALGEGLLALVTSAEAGAWECPEMPLKSRRRRFRASPHAEVAGKPKNAATGLPGGNPCRG